MIENLLDVASAGSALVAVAISSFVLRMQIQDRKEERRNRERAIAARVSCWADWSPDGLPVLSGKVLRDPVVCVANHTDEPAYGAFIDYRDQADGHTIRVSVGTVPPGSTKAVPIVVQARDLPTDWAPEQLLPTLYFRDTRNRWWYRNTVGYLTPDPGPGHDEHFESDDPRALPTAR